MNAQKWPIWVRTYPAVTTVLRRAESAFRANSEPAGPTESITLRDSRHGSGVWLSAATH
jgi:hypothetical protein